LLGSARALSLAKWIACLYFVSFSLAGWHSSPEADSGIVPPSTGGDGVTFAQSTILALTEVHRADDRDLSDFEHMDSEDRNKLLHKFRVNLSHIE
jgi:hypothetical protein